MNLEQLLKSGAELTSKHGHVKLIYDEEVYCILFKKSSFHNYEVDYENESLEKALGRFNILSAKEAV